MAALLRKTLCIALSLAFAGCIFAPDKYGRSGIVTPGCDQFDNYLASCRKRYAVLDKCCERMGTPSAIQIGNSGGYFVWRDQQQWVCVKSFSASVASGRHPRGLRPYVGGLYAEIPKNKAKVAAQGNVTPQRSQGQYTVENFSRTADDDFAYEFRLRINQGADTGLSAMNAIKQDLRQSVVTEYVATYGGILGDVRVDFPEFSMKESVVEGRAEVMRISVVSLQYDATRRKGVISVKIGANRFEDARKWVRKNIETLAKDKNIALTTGTIPPETRFYLGAERVKEGNVLEIEFETE